MQEISAFNNNYLTMPIPHSVYLAEIRRVDDELFAGMGKVVSTPDFLLSDDEIAEISAKIAEQEVAKQKALAKQKLDDEQFVSKMRHETARAGGMIRFPAMYAGDLMSVAARALKQEPANFGFITRHHGRSKIDNTPIKLLERAGLIERKGDLPLKPLTREEEGELEDYLLRFDLIARVTEEAIEDAIELSEMSNRSIVLAFMSREPEMLSEKRMRRRAREGLALHAMLVGGIYGFHRCTKAARKARGEQLALQDEWAETQAVYNAVTGTYFKLSSSTKKRQYKLAEMYVIAKGIEAHIALDDLEWASVVITCPPRMHPNPKKGKRSWDGTLPHEAAAWLANGWAQVRARLAKFNIILSGLWTREAHKDSCPHVNVFVVFEKGQYREVARAFKSVFNHHKRAVKIRQGERVAPGQKVAKFATYAMKYFMKHLAGWGKDEAADSEEATAAAFAYRRHAFFGIPALSTWRELRRLKEAPITSPLLAATWRAVHRKDAAEWITLCGGLACKRSHRPVQPLREIPHHATTPQVVGVNELVAIQEEIIVCRGWGYTAGVEAEARCKGGSATYTKVSRKRHYATATKTVFADSGAQLRTRIPGAYKIVPLSQIEKMLANNGQVVTVRVSNPRGSASAAYNPINSPPNTSQTLH